MSDHVTWEVCPRCGGLAAVGWAHVDGAPAEEHLVEFDCPTGCRVSLDVLARAYSRVVCPTPSESGSDPGQPPQG
jgi:hypothetical protein